MMKECAAKEYGDCTAWGVEETDVLFRYRDKYGGTMPDEIVKVCMCAAHRTVLEKIHEGQPLAMRGDEVDWAIHDDLLSPFCHKHSTYTYLKMLTNDKEGSADPNYKYCVVNGRDIEKFRQLMAASDPDIGYISEVAIFLIQHSLAVCDFDVVEMKVVTNEYDINILKNLPTYYSPASNCIIHREQGYVTYEYRVEPNPTLETEYTIETFFPCVNKYFAQKWEDHFKGCFEECLEFMDNIDHTLVDIEKLRENSPYSQEALLGLVRRLTDALCVNDREYIAEMKEAGEITEEVLWVTYVLANHELYWSDIPGRNLRKNIPLIKLFIAAGLHDRLLLLAVSGERERCLDRHRRTHHDILHENVNVVRYLVPKYFQPRTVIALRRSLGVTYKSAYEYYMGFSNAMFNCNPQHEEEPFEKNPEILFHLLKHMVEENTAFLEKTGFIEAKCHTERRLEYEALTKKIKEENEKWGYDTYAEKEELEWKKALENEGE